MNTGIIDQFLNTFTTYIDSGFGLLGGEVAFLATTLIGIDVTLAALFWAWSPDEDILARLVKKTLYVGFFALLIGNWNSFAKIVFDSFSGLGLKAAGSALSAGQFLQPGRIAQVGIDAGTPILQAISSLVGYTTIFSPTSWVQIGVLFVAWLIVVVSFFVLAIQLFVTLIEFKLTTLTGFVLVPFGLFGSTAFLAERVLGNVIASGVKILVLAIIVGIGTACSASSREGSAAISRPLKMSSPSRWRPSRFSVWASTLPPSRRASPPAPRNWALAPRSAPHPLSSAALPPDGLPYAAAAVWHGAPAAAWLRPSLAVDFPGTVVLPVVVAAAAAAHPAVAVRPPGRAGCSAGKRGARVSALSPGPSDPAIAAARRHPST